VLPGLALRRGAIGAAMGFDFEFYGSACNAADLEVPNPAADPGMARHT
jgi:hypothetical protein